MLRGRYPLPLESPTLIPKGDYRTIFGHDNGSEKGEGLVLGNTQAHKCFRTNFSLRRKLILLCKGNLVKIIYIYWFLKDVSFYGFAIYVRNNSFKQFV